ncbi:MAG: 2-hydroxyacid dehydrogenase [Methyloligellaceae bacterium]
MANILCLRPKADFSRVDAAAPASLYVEYTTRPPAELLDSGKEFEGLVIPAVGPPLSPDLFRRTRIRLVQVTGAGVDRLDRDAMVDLGIAVANVPGGSNEAVAEYVIATALMLSRRLSEASSKTLSGYDNTLRNTFIADLPRGLAGGTVGIVGLGTIGTAVARAFHALGAHICAFDERIVGSELEFPVRSVALDELLEQSDIVTLHVPLTPETRNLIDARALSRLQPHAYLINAARGGIVDETALAEALGDKRLAGAAVDVFSREPADADNPLMAAAAQLEGRLLLTPHLAGISRQAWQKLFTLAWQNVADYLCHDKPLRFRIY